MANLNSGDTQVSQLALNTVGAAAAQVYDFSGISPSDFLIANSDNPTGSKWTTISVDPLTAGTKSTIKTFAYAPAPLVAYFESSISQRYKGTYATVYLGSVDAESLVPAVKSYSIASISQTTSTLTIVLNEAFNGSVGSWADTFGIPDNRLNYFNLCISSVSLDRLTLTATVNDETMLPSLTVGPYLGVGTMRTVEMFSGANNAAGFRSSGGSATSSACISRFGGGSGVFMSGTPAWSHLVTTGTTAPTFVVSSTGQYSIASPTRFSIRLSPREVCFADKASDSSSSIFSTRALITNVKPDDSKPYRLVFEAVSSISKPVPIAKIVSATKTGTSTATIVTDVPHGLNALSYVQTYSINDRTNFPNLAAPTLVSSIVDAYTFTIVIAGSVTATSYGGGVSLCNGGQTQPGLIGQSVTSVARDANGYVTVVGNTTWAGLNVGGHINLYGVRDLVTGADIGVDGAYRVLSLATSTMILGPLTDLFGVVRSPVGGVITTTNCGGAVIDRVEVRTQDIGLEAFNDSVSQILGQGTNDLSLALPVTMAATAPVSAVQNTAAFADIASAALTTTSTSAAISNALGNAFQVNMAVTAVAGTSPTLDLRIQESFDGGTNWETLYDFQRVTGTGSYNSPVLRSVGRHIRYVRTIGGSSPSFTNAVVRNVLPFSSAEPQKRLIDRSIVLTTLNSTTPTLFSGAANNIQLVVNVGAITTTAPALQIEGSEDGGATFYPIGSPLTALASSTVEVTVSTKSATHIRARVSTAGVGVTAGYVSLKAWS